MNREQGAHPYQSDTESDNTISAAFALPITQEPSWNMSAGHDPLCCQSEGMWDGGCDCKLIAQVVERERAKYQVPVEPERGENHVDYCRDLGCYGCIEVTS